MVDNGCLNTLYRENLSEDDGYQNTQVVEGLVLTEAVEFSDNTYWDQGHRVVACGTDHQFLCTVVVRSNHSCGGGCTDCNQESNSHNSTHSWASLWDNQILVYSMISGH